MPLRDLKCVNCNNVHEALIRNDQDLLEEKCPDCGQSQFEFQLSYPSNYTISGDNSASVRPKKSKANL